MNKLDKLNPKKVLPSKLITLVVELVEKYKLGETKLFDIEGVEKGKAPKRSVGALEDQPFEKIKKIVGEIIIGKFTVEDLPSLINQRLEVTKKEAESIADELANILLFTGVVPKKGAIPEEKVSKKEEVLKEEEAPEEEKVSKEEEIPVSKKPSALPKKESKKEEPSEEDIYREPIE